MKNLIWSYSVGKSHIILLYECKDNMVSWLGAPHRPYSTFSNKRYFFKANDSEPTALAVLSAISYYEPELFNYEDFKELRNLIIEEYGLRGIT